MNDFQKNIADIEKLNKNTAVANIGGIILYNENIEYDIAREVLFEIIKKTPSIRLRLNKNYELYETEYHDFNFPFLQVEGGYDGICREVGKIMQTPFDDIFDRDLFDFGFIQSGKTRAGWLKLHHILGDGASIVLFCKKFDEGCNTLLKGEKLNIAVNETAYKEISENKLSKAAAYFSKKLENTQPLYLSETKNNDYDASVYHCSVKKTDNNMICAFYSAIYIYLRTVADRKRIVFGNVMGNRSKSEFEMFGMFANTVPFVMEYDDMPFGELCCEISKDMRDILRYSWFSSKMLKTYNNITKPLYDISVSYKIDKFLPKMENGKVIEFFNGCSDTAIRIFAEEYEDRLDFDIHYKKKSFTENQIKNMSECIAGILKQGRENLRISEISILSEHDISMYERFNDTAAKHMYDDIIECFKDHISERKAVLYRDTFLSGNELDKKSDNIASFIKNKNAKRVGLYMKRCPEMIIGAIGALKCGAAFTVISDNIPGMVEKCDIILTQDIIANAEDADFTYKKCSGDDTAYMIFTSGSTGRPKCIEISRTSLMSRLEWANGKFGLDGVILQKTVNTFDVSIWEMLSVIYGAQLCLIESGDEKFPDRIADAIEKYGIEKLHFVPSMLNGFLEYIKINNIKLPTLKTVFSSGEKLEKYTVDKFFSLIKAELYNLYGPAECTIDVSAHKCLPHESEDKDDIPIGTPADNTSLYIINGEDKILPVGCKGEICIAGELVGKGYIGSQNDAFFTFGGKRAYRTGDIGYIGYDGEMYISGRNDSQIKIRGMRIDISGIKNAVCSCYGVSDCIISSNEQRLECYYTGDADEEEIKEKLRKTLPYYAIPSIFHKIDKMVLGSSGKADIKALKKISESGKTNKVQKYLSNNEISHEEQLILDTVKKYISDIDTDTDLFDAGLDSLSVIEIVCELEKKGLNITFADFYEGLNIRDTAKLINSKRISVWLKREAHKKLIVCFPYAGGEPQFFAEVSDKLNCDCLGIYISSFPSDKDIKDIANTAEKNIPMEEYDEIYLYGHCVSSVTVMETAKKMENNKKFKGIILGAPALSGSFPIIDSPWNIFNDNMLLKILNKDGGKKISSKVIKKFRLDTDRYFRYMKKKELPEINCDVILIFGENDLFTKNSVQTEKKLRKYIKGKCVSYHIKGGGHYFVQTHTDEVCDILNKLIGSV